MEHSARLDVDGNPCGNATLDDDFIEPKLERAAKLMAAARASFQCAAVSIQVVSDDSLDAPFAFIIKDTETYYTFRIEYDYDGRNDYDHSIHCATIVMNFGVAYMICAKTSSCAATVRKYQQAALSLWNLADKIFVLHFPDLAGSPGALFVALILYHVLVPSLVNSGLVEEARECSLRLDETARLLGAWNKVGNMARDLAPAA